MGEKFNPAELGEVGQKMSLNQQKLLAMLSEKAAKNEKVKKEPKKKGWQNEGTFEVSEMTARRMNGEQGWGSRGKSAESRWDIPPGTSSVGESSRFRNYH